MQVAAVDHVVIDQSQRTDAGAGEVEGDGRAQSAYSDEQHFGTTDFLLSCGSDFGEHGLSVISVHVEYIYKVG